MNNNDYTQNILETKLHRPNYDIIHVLRPELLEQLTEGSTRPLTLISAPAGYGKSTLASCWLDQCDLPYSWLTLDESDNDLHLFLTYLVSAVWKIDTQILKNMTFLP